MLQYISYICSRIEIQHCKKGYSLSNWILREYLKPIFIFIYNDSKGIHIFIEYISAYCILCCLIGGYKQCQLPKVFFKKEISAWNDLNSKC